MWQCKVCGTEVSSRYKLLKHSKLKHGHSGARFRHPCVYSNCPCTFKSWNNLLSHIYRANCDQSSSKQDQLATFSCQLCACIESNEKDYFCHLNEHLRKNETVTCVFKECTFKSNIYNTFHTHKNRKHNPQLRSQVKSSHLYLYSALTIQIVSKHLTVSSWRIECQ